MCVLGSPTPSCALPLFGDIIRVTRSHEVLSFFFQLFWASVPITVKRKK